MFSFGRGWIICAFIPFFRRDGTCNVEFRMGKGRKRTSFWRTRVLQVYVLYTCGHVRANASRKCPLLFHRNWKLRTYWSTRFASPHIKHEASTSWRKCKRTLTCPTPPHPTSTTKHQLRDVNASERSRAPPHPNPTPQKIAISSGVANSGDSHNLGHNSSKTNVVAKTALHSSKTLREHQRARLCGMNLSIRSDFGNTKLHDSTLDP